MDTREQLDPRVRQRLCAALDEAAADIDAGSAARLREARRQALAAAQSPSPRRWQWLAMGVPVAAAAALVLLVGGAPPDSSTTPAIAAPADAVRDLDVLTSGETLDLLDNLELIRWLPPARNS